MCALFAPSDPRTRADQILPLLVRTLNVPCAGLVPSGPAYANIDIANQVCPTIGSETGNLIVVGSRYLQQSFGYTYANTWRNLSVFFDVHRVVDIADSRFAAASSSPT